jgi:hypothetical protein
MVRRALRVEFERLAKTSRCFLQTVLVDEQLAEKRLYVRSMRVTLERLPRETFGLILMAQAVLQASQYEISFGGVASLGLKSRRHFLQIMLGAFDGKFRERNWAAPCATAESHPD